MKELFAFIDASPTAFHCVESVKKILDEKGFKELKESDDWKLKKGDKFYVKRNGSSLIAFNIPKGGFKGFHIYSAHTDSPSFRIKENPEMVFENNYVRLNVEKYGGMILSTWFDRPLSVAGRVVVKEGDKLVEKLVNVDKDTCVIPNVAIHMNHELNNGYKYGVQNDLLPLFGGEKAKGTFDDFIAGEAGVKKEDILGKDLFLYTRQKCVYTGAGKEFITAPRLDDQACVFAGIKGFSEAKSGSFAGVLAVFDNEEVGSGTKQGADSTFLEDSLFRVCEALSLAKSEYLRAVSESFNISADNAHGVHPAMAGKADPTCRPYLNKGVVLKFNGSQKYATDAVSAAYFKKLAAGVKANVQPYYNNSDVAGGSTLGNISTAHVSVKTADIGLPQFAMHSAVETMGSKDVADLVKIVKAYYEE